MANGSACCCPDLKIRPMPAQFSNGCAIGCDSCDGTSRGPLPGEKNGSSWRGCSKRDASGEWMAKCNLCPEKNVSATICDPKLRTINSQAPCGSPTDYYYYSPWRAPYAPAHLPRCPQPEPAPPPVRIALYAFVRKLTVTHAPTAVCFRHARVRRGSAPVFDSCGRAGGHLPPAMSGKASFGGVYINTTHAKLGASEETAAAFLLTCPSFLLS